MNYCCAYFCNLKYLYCKELKLNFSKHAIQEQLGVLVKLHQLKFVLYKKKEKIKVAGNNVYSEKNQQQVAF